MLSRRIEIPEDWIIKEENLTPENGMIFSTRRMKLEDIFWCDKFVHITKNGTSIYGYRMNCGMNVYSIRPKSLEDSDDDDYIYFQEQFPNFPYFGERPTSFIS